MTSPVSSTGHGAASGDDHDVADFSTALAKYSTRWT